MVTQGCRVEKVRRVDRLLDTLSDQYRREVVDYFENVAGGQTSTLDAVVDHLDDRGTSGDAPRIRKQLMHAHLPKLEARGWLDVDRRTGTIRYYGHDSAGELVAEVGGVFDEE